MRSAARELLESTLAVGLRQAGVRGLDRVRRRLLEARVAAEPDLEARLNAVPEVPPTAAIELTSRCPLDCVFCTRQRMRGAGADMDFALFESIVRQLGRPERVFLNCLGESVHHPRVVDAVRLVKGAGAAAELITTLGTAPEAAIAGLLEAGLDHLHVSLHTLDPALHRALYRGGSLAATRAKLDRFLALRASTGAATVLDFAFVALDRNLASLADVVDLADRIGVRHVSVLALMQPADTRRLFPRELEGNYLAREFRARLRDEIARVRALHPGVRVEGPDLDDAWSLGETPRSFPAPLPEGARISTCHESPWRVITVQANGDVPECGEDGMSVVGNVRDMPLREIWRGPAFQAFRRRHLLGLHPVCRSCPTKDAYLPPPATLWSRRGALDAVDRTLERARGRLERGSGRKG